MNPGYAGRTELFDTLKECNRLLESITKGLNGLGCSYFDYKQNRAFHLMKKRYQMSQYEIKKFKSKQNETTTAEEIS